MNARWELALANPLAQQDDGVDECLLHVTMVHGDERLNGVLAIHHPARIGDQLVDELEGHDGGIVAALVRPCLFKQVPHEIPRGSGDDAISTVRRDVADAAGERDVVVPQVGHGRQPHATTGGDDLVDLRLEVPQLDRGQPAMGCTRKQTYARVAWFLGR